MALPNLPARIKTDPGLAVCPDFSSVTFAFVRSAPIATGTPADRVLGLLVDAWSADNRTQREAWAQQQKTTREEGLITPWMLIDKADNTKREVQLKHEVGERAEVEQRKPIVFPYFRVGVPPPTVSRPCLVPIARKKLKKFEYVELWYFTTAGIAAAKEPTDYTKIEEFMTVIRPLTFRGHRVLKDSELSWRELSFGHVTFLREIEAAKLP
ncbi:hypothetical protein B0H21DRAFT_869365 [Amylocystis lapponica]|nr:hypothetical protein B0H21DRAFT_869365 [Amylocystis lapponica]